MTQNSLPTDTKYEVLIVDDIPGNLQVLGNILTEYNLDVSFANNGQQALEAVSFEPPDLILLDISMPEMDGFEVCQRLQAKPETKPIPIIFVTARTETENIVKGFELGGVDYVTKPFNSSELVSRVFTHLELSKSREVIEKQNHQLKKQNQELKELNATKDKFFSIVAHDLKNPFNTLIGFSEMLIKNYDKLPEEKVKMFHEFINTSSKQGFSLLENLLEWSRSQTGRLDFSPELFDFNDIALEVTELLALTGDKKNIAINNNIQPQTTVFADQNMIKTVLRNLVSNAIKFTPKGGKIDILASPTGSELIIEVTDTGVGIAPEDQQKLFRIDINHSTKGTEKEKGTGLGLILCKEFIEKNSGKIWVESQPGQGSRFRFTLPTKETPKPPAN